MDKLVSGTIKPEEEEMAPVEETEFSDCGSIISEEPAKKNLFFSVQPISILQRAMQKVQESFITPDIEPGQRRQTLLNIIGKNVKKEDNLEAHKKQEQLAAVEAERLKRQEEQDHMLGSDK